MVHVIYPMPTVPLFLYPMGLALVILFYVFHRMRDRKSGIRIHSLVTLSRFKFRVYSFVREINEKRFILVASILHPVQRIIGQQISNISFDLLSLTIDIESWIVVYPLTPKTYPSIKSRLGIVVGFSDVPFPKKRCFIIRFLELLREKNGAWFQRVGIVDGTMAKGVLARKNGGSAWRTKRSGHEGIGDVGSFFGHSIHPGGF